MSDCIIKPPKLHFPSGEKTPRKGKCGKISIVIPFTDLLNERCIRIVCHILFINELCSIIIKSLDIEFAAVDDLAARRLDVRHGLFGICAHFVTVLTMDIFFNQTVKQCAVFLIQRIVGIRLISHIEVL